MVLFSIRHGQVYIRTLIDITNMVYIVHLIVSNSSMKKRRLSKRIEYQTLCNTIQVIN